jgi:glucan phosphorylase
MATLGIPSYGYGLRYDYGMNGLEMSLRQHSYLLCQAYSRKNSTMAIKMNILTIGYGNASVVF